MPNHNNHMTGQARDMQSQAAVPAVQKEIERKWLIIGDRLPDLKGVVLKEIIQGYLAVGADGTEVRIRRKGDKFFETVKGGEGLVRTEVEIALDKDQFDKLWPATEGRRLEKVRYELKIYGVDIELDIYRGTLSGLIVAEVEFSSVEDSRKFTPPIWFGQEVTEDSRYKNQNLALVGWPK